MQARKAILTDGNFGGVRIETFVTIPNDPSLPKAHIQVVEQGKQKIPLIKRQHHQRLSKNYVLSPINRCLRSYPVLSFLKVPSMSSTVPFAKTASTPERNSLDQYFRLTTFFKRKVKIINDLQ